MKTKKLSSDSAGQAWIKLGEALTEVEGLMFDEAPPKGLNRHRPSNPDPILKSLRSQIKHRRRKLASIIPKKDWPKFGIT